MGNCTKATMPHAQALSEAGTVLASAAAGKRPLGIIDDSHDRKQVLLHANRNGQSVARVLASGDFSSLLPIGDTADLPMLAGVDSNQDLRSTVKSAILQTQIYADLQGRDLSDPMALARAFRDMLSEMDEHLLDTEALPEVAQRYSAFAEEINILKVLWEKHCRDGQNAKQEHLRTFARNINAPVAYVSWHEQTPCLLQAFLDTATEHSPVTQLLISLDDTAAALDQLWDKGSAAANIVPQPTVCAAASMEQAAQSALALIGKWQNEGKQKIGIVGYDRQLVRRMHSMCLHHEVVMSDRAGWLANNLLVGDVLLALVDPELEKSARLRLLQLLARQQESETDWVYKASAALKHGEEDPMADLQKNWKSLGRRQSLAAWFSKLASLTEKLPLADFYANDVAADRLRTLLHLLANGYANSSLGNDANVSMIEMRSLLHDVLSSTHLIASNAKSDIQLISPYHFSSDRFDAVLLLGAHADSLPQAQPDDLFNDEVRKALGLPTQEMRLNMTRVATANLLANHDHVAAVWHGARNISPYIEVLDPVHVQPPTPAWRAANAGSETMTSHAAKASKEIMPERISASHLNTLMACPYRFYAQHVLRLRESDGEDSIYQASDFGTFVHNVLNRFHSDWNPKQDNVAALRAATKTHLQESAYDGADTRLYHWLWLSYIDAYAQKMDEFAKKGFKIDSCEKKMEREFDINGTKIAFSGIYDRLDRDDKGNLSVIDVKTGNINGKEIATGELPQLSVYACLAESDPENAAIWQLKSQRGEGDVISIKPADTKDIDYRPKAIFGHTQKIIGDILDGKSMPANGASDTCDTCAMSGICRRPFWQHTKQETT